MTTSHTAKPAAGPHPGPTPLDNASALVLARVEQLDARLEQLELLLRTQHAPTATAHHLMALEGTMLERLKLMSQMMSYMMNRTGGYLQQMAQETAEEHDPLQTAMEAFQLASENGLLAPKGEAVPARGRRPSKKK